MTFVGHRNPSKWFKTPGCASRITVRGTFIALCWPMAAFLVHAEPRDSLANMIAILHAGSSESEPVIAHIKTPGVCLLPVGQNIYPVPYPVVLTGARSEVTEMVNQGMLDARSCELHGLKNMKVLAQKAPMAHTCSKRWSVGRNEDLAWVQYVCHEKRQPVLSFLRWMATQKVEMRINHLDRYKGIKQEPARFAAFSLSTGRGKKALALEGVGRVARDDEGQLVFSTSHAIDSKNIERVRKFIGQVDGFMTLSMESVSLKIPVDKQAKEELRSLYTK